uniref:Uncharacterized protein n=1 Tax=viral metagenome TaxID=1070528 RepID=A0A6C0EJL5_9ZZZZ
MNSLITNIEKQLKMTNLYNNPIILSVLSIFLVMYGPRLQPGLPPSIMVLFNNNLFRFIVMVLIAYLSSRNLQVAMLLSLALCLISSMSSTQEMYLDLGKLTDIFKKIPKNKLTDLLQKIPKNKLTDLLPKNNLTDVPPINAHELEDTPDSSQLDPSTKWINTKEEAPEQNPSAVCKNGLETESCINYCYSMAGFRDEFCQKHFPNPQVNCGDEDEIDKKISCLKNNCNLEENKDKTFCKFSNTLDRMDKITQNILKDVNQYKNPLG